ncbi:putative alpha-galactosidase [Umbelopsis sp. PMI_123]|nr:putative alpha-galactosidase [Umbelopsis sp. PMI_123]
MQLQRAIRSVLQLLLTAKISASMLSSTPPMGFNDWARFECAINQTVFIDAVDSLVSTGLRDVGFKIVTIDDCWSDHNRTSNGSLTWDTKLFPNGLIWLSDYIHKNKMEFGIYSDAGTHTCGGYLGSYDHEEIDAKTFASWGVDYLKLDGCNVDSVPGQSDEETYRQIYARWHPILPPLKIPFSESAPAYFVNDKNLTDWYKVMSWVPKYGQLARHSYDIATYGSSGSVWESVMTNYGYNLRLARVQKKGFYNDPDFIIAGDPNLTMDEQRSHFALWSSFSAPLILSSNIPALTKEHLAYLTNRDLIALDQDPLVRQATLISQDAEFDILAKTLANGDRALTILNKAGSAASLTVTLDKLGFHLGGHCEYHVKDLWTGKISVQTNQIEASNIPSHGTAVYRVTPSAQCKSFLPGGQIFNAFSLNCIGAGSPVASGKCNATDDQFWNISLQGTISVPFAGNTCLSVNGSSVIVEKCSASPEQVWTHGVAGYLVNKGTNLCLTEKNSSIGIAKCGDELDSQVFEIPL